MITTINGHREEPVADATNVRITRRVIVFTGIDDAFSFTARHRGWQFNNEDADPLDLTYWRIEK